MKRITTVVGIREHPASCTSPRAEDEKSCSESQLVDPSVREDIQTRHMKDRCCDDVVSLWAVVRETTNQCIDASGAAAVVAGKLSASATCSSVRMETMRRP